MFVLFESVDIVFPFFESDGRLTERHLFSFADDTRLFFLDQREDKTREWYLSLGVVICSTYIDSRLHINPRRRPTMSCVQEPSSSSSKQGKHSAGMFRIKSFLSGGKQPAQEHSPSDLTYITPRFIGNTPLFSPSSDLWTFLSVLSGCQEPLSDSVRAFLDEKHRQSYLLCSLDTPPSNRVRRR